MTSRGLKTMIVVAVASVFSLNAQNQIPPGTGVLQTNTYGNLLDANWVIVADGTGEAGPVPEPAFIVTPPFPNGWASGSALNGTYWIAPYYDQSNADNPGNERMGSTTYELQFPVANPAGYGLKIVFFADDTATVRLNGVPIFTGTSTLYMNGATATVTTGFLTGNNVLDFVVSNATGGPTGLDVSFAAVSALPPTTPAFGAPTKNGRHLLDAFDDPVDGASGQDYETDSDIELGGPMNLGFRRYYSSRLSNGNVVTALGTNWMSNFDPSAVIGETNAQVLLFEGKIVSFANTGTAWQLVTPKDKAYQFIQSGANFQFMDPDRSWIYTFSPTGVLASIADRNGNTITVTQGANGPTQVSDGLGRTLTFAYTNAQLAQVTDQAGRTLSFTYTGGLLTSASDIYKQTTTYGYAAGGLPGLLQFKQLPLGNIPASQTYDSQGRVLTQRVIPGDDGTAYTASVAYDGSGGTTITHALGGVFQHASTAVGNIAKITDPSGATATITYDSDDRRTSITDKLGNVTRYTYDPVSGFLASVTDALGHITSLGYTAQSQGGFTFYRLSSITYPDGTSISGTFDASGNQVTSTGQNGTVAKYVYDTNGRPVSITGAQGTSTYTWNADSTLASTTDALGNKRTFSYDNTKRITSTVDPNGGTTAYVWDKSTQGPMLATIYPVAGESTTIYDDGNREFENYVMSTGGVYHSDYSATGQLADFIDPLKNTTTYTYDGDDRISSIAKPAGEVFSFAYDSNNRVTSISDANGPRTSYTYTLESKIATAADGSGRKASYAYDVLGRLSTVTTPGGNTYTTAYDKLDNVIKRTNPLGEVESVSRDVTGAIVSATSPGAITTTLVRDASGAITSVTTPNGNTWKIGRDVLERPAKLTDPLGNSTTLSFTGTHLAAATLPLGTLAFTTDADGRVTNRHFSDGTTINTAYDTNRMLSSADGVTIQRDAAGRPSNINGIAITLDADSRPATLTYATGKAVTYTYDKGGRLASVADWVGGKTTLAYDGGGRLTSMTYPNGVVTTYNYDSDGNLINIAAGSLASIALTRDAAGKITSADRNVPVTPALQAAAQQFSYDAAGQLTSATSDAMGRVTAQNGRTYKWNLASQLTAFSDSSNSGAFTYDGLGEMNSSTASGAAQSLVYNYLLPLPALSIVRTGSSDLRYYVYFPSGTLLYSIEAADNTRHFYHFDEMGNTVLLSGDSGAMTDSYAVTPYGENADHFGTAVNPFTWQGQYGVMEEGRGLYYVRSRHYDASAARFLSRDPVASYNPRTAEPYAYANGNPLRFIDPFGTDAESDSLSAANGTTLPSQSPLWSIDAGDAVNYANDYYNRLIDYSNTFKGYDDYLDTYLFFYFYDLATIVNSNQDLDWQGFEANNAFYGIAPPLEVYQPPPGPPATNWTQTVTPAPVQASGPTLTASTCVKVSGCNSAAAASPTGSTPPPALANANPVVSNDGGSVVSTDGGSYVDAFGNLRDSSGRLLTQDGGGLLTQDGGGLLTQDGGGWLPRHGRRNKR